MCALKGDEVPEDTTTIPATNGTNTPRYLPGFGQLDRRTVAARHFRDIADSIVEDLGGEVSTAELELIRRVSGLSVLCSKYESAIMAGEVLSADDHSAYVGALNAQGRALCRLGLRRRSRDVSPSLDMIRRGGVA